MITVEFPPGHKNISRAGQKIRPKITLCQLLQAGLRQKGSFVALIKDPENGTVLKEITLWSPAPGEAVELQVVWDKIEDIK